MRTKRGQKGMDITMKTRAISIVLLVVGILFVVFGLVTDNIAAMTPAVAAWLAAVVAIAWTRRKEQSKKENE